MSKSIFKVLGVEKMAFADRTTGEKVRLHYLYILTDAIEERGQKGKIPSQLSCSEEVLDMFSGEGEYEFEIDNIPMKKGMKSVVTSIKKVATAKVA